MDLGLGWTLDYEGLLCVSEHVCVWMMECVCVDVRVCVCVCVAGVLDEF